MNPLVRKESVTVNPFWSKTDISVDQENMIQRLSHLKEEIDSRGYSEQEDKLEQLMEKVYTGEYMAVFSGHFSAGKSSMINALFEEDLLPSSPIPASANMVQIKSGDPYAKILFKNDEVYEFEHPYDIEEIKNYCLNGNDVKYVEISHPSTFLPEDFVIVDTPGIDSTDDAHRLATEASMHLADIVFYMVDYNHVQSELNFEFVKELEDQNKKVILIVNQIDKHNELEISFRDFKQGVKDAFADWNIDLEEIFFTSLIDLSLEANEFNDLRVYITGLLANRHVEVIQNALEASYLIAENIKETSLQEKLHGEAPKSNEGELQNRYDQLNNQIEALDQKVEEFKESFEADLGKLTKSAILMPFEVREAAKQFMEASQPDFKVGFLFKDKKTKEEKKNRFDTFYDMLSKQASSQLEWHLKELLVQKSKEWEIGDERLFKELYNISIPIPEELIDSELETGAGLTGQAVLNYTEGVSSSVRRIFRQKGLQEMDRLADILSESLEEQKKEIKRERNELSAELKKQQTERALIRKEEEWFIKCIEILEGHYNKHSKEAFQKWQTEKEGNLKQSTIIKSGEKVSGNNEADKNEKKDAEDVEIERPQALDTKEYLVQAAEDLNEAARKVEIVPELSAIARELKQRAERIESREFTVALFGAFSAGKSSFANALLGESVLPVSPNPTTAAINKICPVTAEYPHGTVKVQYKTTEQMLEDIQYSLSYFDMEAETLEEAVSLIKNKVLIKKDVTARAKPHYTFLKAVNKGAAHELQNLDEVQKVGMEAFGELVAKEEKACFVNLIELYYSCPLTDQGITFVDTPGADSINARHTGVAFRYIKESDAILYVTYYNHAFSKADREFLIELGRVKDVFELDKMFFVVNAADLAKNESELQHVVTHVEDNLISYGIRKPRVYPVSSHIAALSKGLEKGNLSKENRDRLSKLLKLKSKEEISSSAGIKESGIQEFENDFTHFISHDLTGLAVAAGYADIDRAISVINDWVSASRQDKNIREKQLNELQKRKEDSIEYVRTFDHESNERAFNQETKELVYYIDQRIFLRFSDVFKESFNPAALSKSKGNVKESLIDCLKELIGFIGFDLAQEMRATALRTEKYVWKIVDETYTKFKKTATAELPGLQLSAIEKHSFDMPDFEEELVVEHFDKLKGIVFSSFKSPKQFFEQNGKELLKEKLEEELKSPVNHYLEQKKSDLQTAYWKAYQIVVEELEQKVIDEVNNHVEGKKAALSVSIDPETLEDLANSLKKIMPESS
ncbi:dynamin family protein [Pseudalkalibacillus caeni]|uniref:Dynamin N-terminal domain-containing protein n=1 Tax=Exobacillus caeni TaxID=2574798 RepID=A0A5R9F748_9BACL|nr:dynamin family protein [Pseudalkalibacillus caeni]TLS37458.1 hypothetical protein FCL54_09945 [Pseudalkalibacillus caeni]